MRHAVLPALLVGIFFDMLPPHVATDPAHDAPGNVSSVVDSVPTTPGPPLSTTHPDRSHRAEPLRPVLLG